MRENQTSIREIHHIGATTRERLVSASVAPRLGALGITLCGLTDAAPDYEFCRLNPEKSHVVASVSGQGLVWLDDRWCLIEPGWAYLTPLGVPHAFKPRPGRDWRLAWVSYRRPFVVERSPLLIRAATDALWRTIEGLHAEVGGDNHPALGVRWADLVNAESERIRDRARGAPGPGRVWALVGTEPERPWTLQTLARLCGISHEQLRRLCWAEHRTTPMRYVTALRLRASLSLLGQPSLGLEEIATRIGYSSAFAFSHVFKKWFGVSPKIMRARVLQGLPVPDPVERLRRVKSATRR